MPDIHIHRDHSLGLAKARKVAWDWAEQANARPPELQALDARGRRIDRVDFHPHWHRLLGAIRGTGALAAPFNGLGMRGNASSPVTATQVKATMALGEDGKGFDIMMGVVLPWFSVLNASCSVGTMDGSLARAIAHVSATRHQHLDSSLADLPTIRAYLAKARIKADMANALLQDTLAAISGGRADTMLRVLEVKAACAETALEVTDAAMRVCGGAAFRKEVGVERLFRDARAAHVMAPTTDVLYDFIGKAITGLPLF